MLPTNAPRLTPAEAALLADLRAAADYSNWDWDIPNAGHFAEIYLDNVPLRSHNPRRFAALTGALAKKGYYKTQDDCFGLVKMDRPPGADQP